MASFKTDTHEFQNDTIKSCKFQFSRWRAVNLAGGRAVNVNLTGGGTVNLAGGRLCGTDNCDTPKKKKR